MLQNAAFWQESGVGLGKLLLIRLAHAVISFGLCCALTAHGLEPKRLRLVCHRADSAPSLALLEARRGGRPGLRIEPMLVLTDLDGGESAEYKRIYHR
ncbi:MAG: hypothetical protein IJK35_05100, partial [Oscillospiraceae bacterium]|nr:hypothetical protein [Oscillospiraceae bacterium]